MKLQCNEGGKAIQHRQEEHGEKLPILEPFSKDEEKKTARLFPSYRLAISVLSFCGLFLSAQSQSSMGAAIVCMVSNGSGNNTFATFDWDKTTQGWILSIRFLAYYLAQLPAGYLTSHISNRIMAAIGFVAMGTFDVMTVPCAKNSVTLFVVRVAQGLGNALVSIGSYDILGKWIPRHESSALLGFAGIGFLAGSFPMFMITSIVCEKPLMGWPHVFYFSGVVTLVFSALWYMFVDDEPALSRWAGQEEKDYIMACKQNEVFRGKIPWRAMLTSIPIYGIVSAQFALEWLLYFTLTVAPAFFIDIFHFSQEKADLVCGLPYIFAIPICTLFGRFLDTLRQYKCLSTIGIRRLAQCVGNLVPAACCMVLALLPVTANPTGVVTAFFLCVVSFICTSSGWTANVSDLVPQHGGAAFSLCQTLAAWVSFVVPVLVNYITAQKTKEQWNTVFYITVGIQLICFLGFCILASGDVQPWAKSEERIPLSANEAVCP